MHLAHETLAGDNRASVLSDALKTSPCLICQHIKEDKKVCKLLSTCPLHVPTKKPPEIWRPKRVKKQLIGTKKCPVDGCGNNIQKNALVCQEHWPRTNHRMNKGVPPNMLLDNGKLPNNWRELYGTFDYQTGKSRVEVYREAIAESFTENYNRRFGT